jgi:hypothetical protein
LCQHSETRTPPKGTPSPLHACFSPLHLSASSLLNILLSYPTVISCPLNYELHEGRDLFLSLLPPQQSKPGLSYHWCSINIHCMSEWGEDKWRAKFWKQRLKWAMWTICFLD